MESNTDINYLKTSPMFQLSLSSKELFHSNFLYWLYTLNRNNFLELFRKLLKNKNLGSNWGEWEVKREYNHYDLCVISHEDKDEIIHLVLENKFKSLPNIQQLDKYCKKTQKCECHVLLTLADKFPNKEKITDWTIINYKDLGKAISVVFSDVVGYEAGIIRDYINVISIIHNQSVSWKVLRGSLFSNSRKEYVDLRIDDIYIRKLSMRKCWTLLYTICLYLRIRLPGG
ncbi:MAG: PD-(D/E)XK nuclease family protein [Muribaculaceae bacterium]|nr:PD-(D/E)XK nuclease family protein [Muribaculaceae bacterium]